MLALYHNYFTWSFKRKYFIYVADVSWVFPPPSCLNLMYIIYFMLYKLKICASTYKQYVLYF